MILQEITRILFNELGDFGGRGGLDKNFAANSGVVVGKLLVAVALGRLERRDHEIRGKATAKGAHAEGAKKGAKAAKEEQATAFNAEDAGVSRRARRVCA
jgi:hypothetical protein